MRPEKAGRENPIGEEGRTGGEAACSLSEAAGFPLEHRNEKRTFVVSFFFWGGEGGWERVVGWTGFFVATKRTFWKHLF